MSQCAYCCNEFPAGQHKAYRCQEAHPLSAIWIYCSDECMDKHVEAEAFNFLCGLALKLPPERRAQLIERLK